MLECNIAVWQQQVSDSLLKAKLKYHAANCFKLKKNVKKNSEQGVKQIGVKC